ncbi:GNAT family N-acetyltransferase [Microbacterium sp. BH-3-3-3]|uniref:GNAT family N-acetyltransferase n=1 Tax=Microbacterium sp. BH-3-3-3 TaxID=1906742 RepID=UPI0021B2C4CF|nr:GNAT family N-acetyltransferase [Microbacterium sp. BH-3-3-3]
MGISLTRAALSELDDRAALTAFLTANTFPFHVRTRPTAGQVAEAIRAGAWEGEGIETFWIDDERDGRVGVLRLDDLNDATAMVDLRLADAARGRGHGSDALRIATDLVFSRHPVVIRLEGQTREDNVAMRRVFERCGWVFEAYYRDGWPVEGGEPAASVAYSVLRRDWVSGATTPVPRGPEVTLRGELRCADAAEAERVRAHLDEHLALTRAESGCLSFDVIPSETDGVWSVSERFVDEAAFDAHQRRVATSTWGRETAGIQRSYVIRGRAQDAESLIATVWAAEEMLLHPAVRAHAGELRRLLDPDFVEIGQSGRRWTRDEIIAALREEPGADPSPAIAERDARVLGPTTVLLTYLLRFEDRVSRRSSLWRCDPAPRCLFHQGTPVG